MYLKNMQEWQYKKDLHNLHLFSALTGYDDVIKETARETNSRIEINEEQKQF